VIVVDGAVDLPEEAVAWADVITVPARVRVDGQPFEGLPGAFWQALRDGRSVATTAPSVTDLAAAYERGEPVVAVHVSGDLSLTIARAREAADRSTSPVTVVDSGSLSVGAGLAALEARRLAAAPADSATPSLSGDVHRALEHLPARVHTFAVVEDPAWLVRSGRAGFVTGHVSTRRPVLLAVHGRPVVLDQPRDRRGAVKHLARRVHDHGLADAAAWALGHADADDAEDVTGVLAAVFGRPPMFVVPVDAAVGAHLGPDSLVVGVMR
jgi:DegV family protein with EDD domain